MALGELANCEVFVRWVARILSGSHHLWGAKSPGTPFYMPTCPFLFSVWPSGSVPGLGVNQEGLNLSPLVDLTSVLTETLI